VRPLAPEVSVIRALSSASALLLVACADEGATPTGSDTAGTPTEAPSVVALSFDLDADLIPSMSEPAVGVFRGSVYAEADASATGPVDGAASLLDFTSEPLDFGAAGGVLAGPSLDPLDPQIVWVLGCFDTATTESPDGDDCECGDPITLPNEAKFQLVPGDNALTVPLSLLHPC
jgi:hypothetical protein